MCARKYALLFFLPAFFTPHIVHRPVPPLGILLYLLWLRCTIAHSSKAHTSSSLLNLRMEVVPAQVAIHLAMKSLPGKGPHLLLMTKHATNLACLDDLHCSLT